METTDDRRNALIQEARALKVAIDVNWTPEQMEKVIAKKRPKPAPTEAEPAPTEAEPAAAQEGGDDTAADAFFAERNELLAAKEALSVQVAELKAENEKLTVKLTASNAALFDLEAEKSKVDTELFDLRLAAAGGKEVAIMTEDFGGPKEASAKPRAVRTAATVMCKVTKAGDGQIFDGNGGRYKRNDMCEFPAETAATLEAKGLVETD